MALMTVTIEPMDTEQQKVRRITLKEKGTGVVIGQKDLTFLLADSDDYVELITEGEMRAFVQQLLRKERIGKTVSFDIDTLDILKGPFGG